MNKNMVKSGFILCKIYDLTLSFNSDRIQKIEINSMNKNSTDRRYKTESRDGGNRYGELFGMGLGDAR